MDSSHASSSVCQKPTHWLISVGVSSAMAGRGHRLSSLALVIQILTHVGHHGQRVLTAPSSPPWPATDGIHSGQGWGSSSGLGPLEGQLHPRLSWQGLCVPTRPSPRLGIPVRGAREPGTSSLLAVYPWSLVCTELIRTWTFKIFTSPELGIQGFSSWHEFHKAIVRL